MLRTLYIFTLLGLIFLWSPLSAQILLSEDFANDLPEDWISRVVAGNNLPSAAWQHTTVGPRGERQRNDPLASPSAANGWMVFDSDVNCNEAGIQNAWLISPPIDALETDTAFLQFATYYQSFNDRPQVRIGADLDDLTSWAVIEVFPGIEANDFGGFDLERPINPVYRHIDLSPWVAGRADQRIAFQFLSDASTDNYGDVSGCAYAWQIDDVMITTFDSRPNFDMLIKPFAAIPPNAVTPLCQVEPIHFMADVANYGQKMPDSTVLRLTIHNTLGDELVFMDSVVYGPIRTDSVAENIFFSQSFLPAQERAIYRGAYSLHYPGIESDPVPENNVFNFSFQVSDNLFGKETESTPYPIAPAGYPSYSIGNVFFVPNGNGDVIEDISFRVANADLLVGRSVSIFVASWDGTHIDDRYINANEYNTIGFSDYTFEGGQNLITVPIREDSGDHITLTDSTYYLAFVSYNTTDEVTMEMNASERRDYFATIFQTDSLSIPRYSSILNVVGIPEHEGNRFDLLGFGYDIVPVIRMTISCESVSTDVPAYTNKPFSLSPNPTNSQINIDFDPQFVNSAIVRLYNLQGQLLLEQIVPEASNQINTFDLTDLPANTYLLTIYTANGQYKELIVKQ